MGGFTREAQSKTRLLSHTRGIHEGASLACVHGLGVVGISYGAHASRACRVPGGTQPDTTRLGALAGVCRRPREVCVSGQSHRPCAAPRASSYSDCNPSLPRPCPGRETVVSAGEYVCVHLLSTHNNQI